MIMKREFSKLNKSSLEKYTVYIESHESTGSGVLFKPNTNSKYALLLSAKHVFKSNSNSGGLIQDYDISIRLACYQHLGELNLIDNSIYLLEGSFDIAIGVVSLEESEHFNNVFYLPIFNDEIDKDDDVMVIGFSDARKRIKTHNRDHYETDIFSVSDIRSCQNDDELVASNVPDGTISGSDRNGYTANTIIENSRGMSGGGVFVKRNEDVYLYGILTEVRHGSIFKNHRVGDEDIIAKLQSIKNQYSQLEHIDKEQFFLSSPCFFGKTTRLDFQSVMDSLNIEELRNKIGKNCYIDKVSSVEKHEDLLAVVQEKSGSEQTANQLRKKLIKNQLDVASYFGFIGLKFFEFNDYYRSSYYINQAAKIDPEYHLIALKAKCEKANGRKDNEITSDIERAFSKLAEYSRSEEDKLKGIESIIEMENNVSFDKVIYALQLIKKLEKETSSVDAFFKRKERLLNIIENKLNKYHSEGKITDEGFYIQMAEILQDYGGNDFISKVVKHYRMALNFIKLKNNPDQKELKNDILKILNKDEYSNIPIEMEAELEFDAILNEMGGQERYLQQEMVKQIQSTIQNTSSEVRLMLESSIKNNNEIVNQQKMQGESIERKISYQAQLHSEMISKFEVIFKEINNGILNLERDPIRKTELLEDLSNIKNEILKELSNKTSEHANLIKDIGDSATTKTDKITMLLDGVKKQAEIGAETISNNLYSKENILNEQLNILKDVADRVKLLTDNDVIDKKSIKSSMKNFSLIIIGIFLSSLITYFLMR